MSTGLGLTIYQPFFSTGVENQEDGILEMKKYFRYLLNDLLIS